MGAFFKLAVCRVWGWQKLWGLASWALPEVSHLAYKDLSYCS